MGTMSPSYRTDQSLCKNSKADVPPGKTRFLYFAAAIVDDTTSTLYTWHPGPTAPHWLPGKGSTLEWVVCKHRLKHQQGAHRHLRTSRTPGQQPIGTRVSPVYCQHLNSKNGCQQHEQQSWCCCQTPQSWTPALASALIYVINSSLSRGHVPSEWKEAIVIPVHKSGQIDEPEKTSPHLTAVSRQQGCWAPGPPSTNCLPWGKPVVGALSVWFPPGPLHENGTSLNNWTDPQGNGK